jgi:chaperone protein EcpD
MHFLTRCLAIASVCLGGFMVTTAEAGIVLGGTRVVYPASDREVTLSITNEDAKQPRLVQTWIDAGDAMISPDKVDVPFHVTPPIFRMEPKASQSLRIVYSKEPLPTDRESVFWLNVLEVPPKPEAGEGTNMLQFAFRTRIKMFFRPDNLPGKPEDAPKALTWTLASEKDASALTINNPTPYYISFQSVELVQGGHSYKAPGNVEMVAPFGSVHVPLEGKVGAGVAGAQVQFKTINDFGGFASFSSPLK